MRERERKREKERKKERERKSERESEREKSQLPIKPLSLTSQSGCALGRASASESWCTRRKNLNVPLTYSSRVQSKENTQTKLPRKKTPKNSFAFTLTQSK